MKPVAIVTGAGRKEGIGFEVCRQLGAQGFHVVLTARDARTAEERARELAAVQVEAEGAALDVANPESVTAFVRRIQDRPGRLDALVNNAAATSVFGEKPSAADLTRAHTAMEVTLFGTWRLTQALLPLLKKSSHPRVVNVSSGGGSYGDPEFGLASKNATGPAYAVSKAALNALTVAFAHELRSAHVLVNAVCPGFTATFPGAEKMGARPVSAGAASVVWGVTLPDDGPTGGFFRDGKPLAW